MKVGITWAGRPTHPNDRNRTFPLSLLAPLANPDIAFVSLQKGPGASQTKQPPEGMDITDVSADLKDFYDTAALIQNLDLVISADTAVVHMAGALNKPVWVFLPFVPDWRWMMDRTDSPWYPTMRLFRQPQMADWSTPVTQVVEALRQEIKAWLAREGAARGEVSAAF